MRVERCTITDHAQWLAWRAHDLTASDIAAWAGVDPFKSRLQLWGEKTGRLSPPGENTAMRRGRWLEAAVITAMKEQHPDWVVLKSNVYIRAPELRFGCTPDAVAEIDGNGKLINLQLKTVSRPVYERDWSDGPPLGYQLQTLSEGLLMGAERSFIAALVIDTYSADLALWPVPRHTQAENRVLDLVADFWKNIDQQPAPDYGRDKEAVEKLFATSTPEPALDLSGDNRLPELLRERATLQALLATTKVEVDAMDTEIKAKLGEHQRATLPGWRISWKPQTRHEYIVPETTFRVLRVTPDKEEAA